MAVQQRFPEEVFAVRLGGLATGQMKTGHGRRRVEDGHSWQRPERAQRTAAVPEGHSQQIPS